MKDWGERSHHLATPVADDACVLAVSAAERQKTKRTTETAKKNSQGPCLCPTEITSGSVERLFAIWANRARHLNNYHLWLLLLLRLLNHNHLLRRGGLLIHHLLRKCGLLIWHLLWKCGLLICHRGWIPLFWDVHHLGSSRWWGSVSHFPVKVGLCCVGFFFLSL